MGSSDKFCLRWNDFECNISNSFRDLRLSQDFFDVSLAVEENNIVQGHKVILAACSPIFRNILARQNMSLPSHPVIYLRGIKMQDLRHVLDFMYHGEVNVAQEDLNSFLAVAEDLQIKGLTHNEATENTLRPTKEVIKRNEPPNRDENEPLAKKRLCSRIPETPDDDIVDVTPLQEERGGNVDMDGGDKVTEFDVESFEYKESEGEGYEEAEPGTSEGPSESLDFQTFFENHMDTVAGGYLCDLCQSLLRSRSSIKRHFEDKHQHSNGYLCPGCKKIYKTKNTFKHHIFFKHKEWKGLNIEKHRIIS